MELNGGDLVFVEASSDGALVQVVVVPQDGCCEGCGERLKDEAFETDDMVVLCRPCYESCVEEPTSA